MKLRDLKKCQLSEYTLYIVEENGLESRLIYDEFSDTFGPQYGHKEYTPQEVEEMTVIGITGRGYCKINIILQG